MKNIVIITGNDLRHTFFRKYVASNKNINVLKSYSETSPKNSNQQDESLMSRHLLIREQTEKDFFEIYCNGINDFSNPQFINKGDINNEEYVNEIIVLNPDLIISYGCSIIKSRLLEKFENRFINIHLGLSPYYRGSGTNFFPFVNNELEYVGVTYMHINEGIDEGEIIHQIRPTIFECDNNHQIGNRLIKEMTITMVKLINNFEKLILLQQFEYKKENVKLYRQKDFTVESVQSMYDNFSNGMIKKYLDNKNESESKVPILQNPILL